ncbi:methyltransferase family protein [Isoptericola sp. CG 20/1183]|uniref:Methyltransferase family protein n=1 Tax=Isoptericola halotolerans TaxID=300560 RepID=A0ABX5EI45_9MICO|nr:MULTISPECIES: methyltransferase domain-containing protein [Isoptericola]PRZ04090.1 methyltransferase family protein [Isoptericola sp. CG 20/1183]PRZ10085.1 methyltransferase family protein [Isoptericola halotolerans]
MTRLEMSAACAGRAAEYIDRLGSVEAMPELARARIATWATGLTGPVLDAGCGPGHWTDFLARQGCDVEGVDLTASFVEHAVSTAWFWPVPEMSALLERAGFEVQDVERRADDGNRPHAAIVARRC